MFNNTLNNLIAILWLSILFVEEIRVQREHYLPATCVLAVISHLRKMLNSYKKKLSSWEEAKLIIFFIAKFFTVANIFQKWSVVGCFVDSGGISDDHFKPSFHDWLIGHCFTIKIVILQLYKWRGQASIQKIMYW